jgi:hypothetical protein
MSYANGPRIVTNGLVLYLDAGNSKSYPPGSGTAWNDLSGNDNNGTLTNGPTFSSANAGSIVFDGVDDYVVANNSTSTNISTNVTYSIWLKPSLVINNTGQNNSDVSFFRKQKTASGFVLEVYGTTGSNKQLAFWVNYPSGVAITYTLSANQWYHLVGTYNGSIAYLYVNGYSVASNSFATSVSTSDPIHIGTFIPSSTPTRYFNGQINNCSIHNRALTASEVLQNYNATKGRFGL